MAYILNDPTIFDTYMLFVAHNNCIAVKQIIHKSPNPVELTRDAAGYGNLPLLKVLHENGCPWDESTFDKLNGALSGNDTFNGDYNDLDWKYFDCLHILLGGDEIDEEMVAINEFEDW